MASQRVVRLDIAYDGTDFQGFNTQPGRRTVQGVLEDAWSQVTGERIRITAAGRTDTGVHASGQVGSLRTQTDLSPQVIQRALNATMPGDVAVLDACDAAPSFDARRSALARHYRYTFWTGKVRHVRCQRFSWHMPRALDVQAMEHASALLLGQHDFRLFAARLARSSVSSTVRTVSAARWSNDGDGFLYFDISANGFLRRMVRGIVGTLVMIGQGRLEPDSVFSESKGGDHAPPHGLTLTRVDYEI